MKFYTYLICRKKEFKNLNTLKEIDETRRNEKMPYIEQEKLQELIEDVNILDVVDYLGIECHKRGSNYFMLCPSPKHNDIHATNCYCKDGGKRVSCKACGYFASPIELVKDVTGMGFFDAVRVVWQLAGCPSYLYQKETVKKNVLSDL